MVISELGYDPQPTWVKLNKEMDYSVKKKEYKKGKYPNVVYGYNLKHCQESCIKTKGCNGIRYNGNYRFIKGSKECTHYIGAKKLSTSKAYDTYGSFYWKEAKAVKTIQGFEGFSQDVDNYFHL